MWIDGRIIAKKGDTVLIRQYWSFYVYSAKISDVQVNKNDHRDARVYWTDARFVRSK